MEQNKGAPSLAKFIEEAEKMELPEPQDMTDAETATFYMLTRLYPVDSLFRFFAMRFVQIFAVAASNDKADIMVDLAKTLDRLFGRIQSEG